MDQLTISSLTHNDMANAMAGCQRKIGLDQIRKTHTCEIEDEGPLLPILVNCDDKIKEEP